MAGLGERIQVIDLHFQGRAGTVAAFAVGLPEGGLLLVETGPASCAKVLDKRLRELGYDPEQDVREVLVTHIHFDHAGGAWRYAERGAHVHVHPRGQRHLASPERLYASAERIYGTAGMQVLWGSMVGIAEDRLEVWQHEEERRLGGLTVQALHTPGHASHHIAWLLGEEALFLGDVGGVCLASDPSPYVEPPCPPPDLDREQWLDSIAILLSLSQNRADDLAVFLTHFGRLEAGLQHHLGRLRDELEAWIGRVEHMTFQDAAADERAFTAWVADRRTKAGASHELLEWANPARMSVAGIQRYLTKGRQL